LCRAVDQFQLGVWSSSAKPGEQLNQQRRRNRTHDREVQPHRCLGCVVLGLALRDLRLVPGVLQVGLDEPAQLREMDSRSFAMKQLTSKLRFQELDRSRQRRLGDVAPPGRLCEAQTLTYRKKISNLMHFHARFLSDADGCYFD
jgi:hypothetical protein